jgi:hypothetical protein
MEEDDLKQRLLELSKKEASLNFKMYELYEENRTLAIRLSGYAAENRSLGGKGVSEEVQKIIDRYLLSKGADQ